MSDDLTISTGGGTSVAVEDLYVEAARLGAVAATARDWAERAEEVRRGLAHLDLDAEPGSWGAVDLTFLLRRAKHSLDATADQSGRLRRALLDTSTR